MVICCKFQGQRFTLACKKYAEYENISLINNVVDHHCSNSLVLFLVWNWHKIDGNEGSMGSLSLDKSVRFQITHLSVLAQVSAQLKLLLSISFKWLIEMFSKKYLQFLYYLMLQRDGFLVIQVKNSDALCITV